MLHLADKIETQPRALKILGLTSDEYASMLHPRVESCLTKNIIRVQERRLNLVSEAHKPSDKLSELTRILKSEVEAKKIIYIAAEGFGFKMKRIFKNSLLQSDNEKQYPNLMGLFDATDTR